MNFLKYTTVITDKKRRVFATFLSDYKLTPVDGEIFLNKNTTILRLKNWSCTQGFATVLGHGEHKTRELQEILCSRYKKKIRNTYKLTEETRRRSYSLVNHNKYFYKIKIRYYKRYVEWRFNI